MPQIQWIGLFLDESIIEAKPKCLKNLEPNDIKKYEEVLGRSYLDQKEIFKSLEESKNNIDLNFTIHYQGCKLGKWREMIVELMNQKLKAEIEILNEFSNDAVIHYIKEQISMIDG